MRALESRTAWGFLLVVLGVLFLVQSLGIIPSGLTSLWAAIFGIAGLAFVYVFVVDRARGWWAIIPGFTLLGLAGIMLAEMFAPSGSSPLSGAFFLGMIGLSFWVIYFDNRAFWWAIIPGGTLLTLALIAGLSGIFVGADLGAVFFFGLAATFALLSIVPTPQGNLRWALIPAVVLLILGLVVMASISPFGTYIGYLWPVALILLGLYLLLRGRGSRELGA